MQMGRGFKGETASNSARHSEWSQGRVTGDVRDQAIPPGATTNTSAVRRGSWGGRGSTPQTRKNCCRKMMLFSKALFLATTFPKNRLKFNFSIEFPSKNFKNCSKFSPIVFFVQTRENLTLGFESF